MENQTNKLENADLEVMLTFPEGDTSAAAQLVISCRKSHLPVAKVSLTAADVVDLLARRSKRSIEGASFLLAERGRAHLNKKRALVSVDIPFGVTIFEDDDSRNLYAWGMDAVRAFGAHDFRVTEKRQSYTLSLVYFLDTISDAERRYLDMIGEQLEKHADDYRQKIAQKLAEQ